MSNYNTENCNSKIAQKIKENAQQGQKIIINKVLEKHHSGQCHVRNVSKCHNVHEWLTQNVHDSTGNLRIKIKNKMSKVSNTYINNVHQ